MGVVQLCVSISHLIYCRLVAFRKIVYFLHTSTLPTELQETRKLVQHVIEIQIGRELTEARHTDQGGPEEMIHTSKDFIVGKRQAS